MNTPRTIVSVPRIGTVIADAEARTLTPRNAKVAKRVGWGFDWTRRDWAATRNQRARHRLARIAVEQAADEIFGRVIAWTWLAYTESDEAA